MLRKGLVVALATLALGLAGCEGRMRAEAARSAERLLTAVDADDRTAFEAEIDRAALREDLRRQILEVAQANALDVDGGPSEFALDRMIGPAAVRQVRAAAGAPLAAGPKAAQITDLLTVVEGRRVCLPDATEDGACLFTFAKQRGGWRLVGMRALDVTVDVASAG